MSIIHPEPCVAAGGDGRDVETILLCDVGDDGAILGTALAVYEYDSITGNPVGPPTFVDPATGAPYVPVGTLQPCASSTDCLTDAELRATPVNVDRPGDGVNLDLLAATGTVTPGSPLVVTPTGSNRLRVWWLCADYSPDDVTTGRVTATLVGKGEIYRGYGVGHRQRFDGDPGGTLTVATTNGTYEATVHYEEIP